MRATVVRAINRESLQNAILSQLLSDAERFKMVASKTVGKRLTFAEVTGKVQETPF